MAIIESLSQCAAGFIAIIKTRLELAAVEVEEECLRVFSYLLISLVALFCLTVAILLTILFIVVLYWDTHRIAVLATLIAIFGLTGIGLCFWIRYHYRQKPRLLSATITELTKDIDSLKPESHSP